MSPPSAVRRVGLAVLAGLLGALAIGGPARAHGADAPDGTDYRTEVGSVAPGIPGLTVRAVEAGARLELTNRTGRTIEVLGYAGEPYLAIRPDGVYENTSSPATYLNRTLAGDTEPPGGVDPARPPSWQRVGTAPVVRWHDQRIRWTESAPPPEVAADPGRRHRVRDWVVPLRDGTATVEVRGTLDWIPPPDRVSWWLLSLLGAVALGGLGLLPRTSRPGRYGTAALAALAGLGGVAAVSLAVARAAGTGGLPQGLLSGQLWPALSGLGALAAAAFLLARRPAADFALALAGACLALFAGVANATAFARSVVPVPWPAGWVRLAVALVLAAGAGMALAGVLRLRAAGPVQGGSAGRPPRAPLAGPPSLAGPPAADPTPAGGVLRDGTGHADRTSQDPAAAGGVARDDPGHAPAPPARG